MTRTITKWLAITLTVLAAYEWAHYAWTEHKRHRLFDDICRSRNGQPSVAADQWLCVVDGKVVQSCP